MRRLLLTLLIIGSLTGGYLVYARVLARLTRPGEAPPVVALEPRSLSTQPPNFARAEQYLTDVDWTERAVFKIKHSDNAFLYFDRYETRGQRVLVEPFALVWHPPQSDDSEPYVFLCEKARLTFEREFQLGAASPGRMIGVALDGAVLITGPHGLKLEGRDCVFSEDELQLYSDHHCKFAYRPEGERLQVVTGEADQLQIDLTPVTYPALGRDLPRVAQRPQRLTLRKNVSLLFQTREKEGLRSTRIVSRGPFVYDFERRLATFQDDVQVARPVVTPEGQSMLDSLACAWLAVQFEEEPGADADGEGSLLAGDATPILGRLRFRILRALGDAQHVVRVSSDQARFRGQMRDLVYDVIQRVLVMQDAVETVRLEHDGATLYTPTLRLVHDDQMELTLAEGTQAGRLDYVRPAEADRPQQTFHALWNQRVSLQPDPLHAQTVVMLEGEARVIQPGEQGILCDRLTLWVEGSRLRRGERSSPVPDSGATSSSPANSPAAAESRRLPLKRVLAEGNVAMTSRQLQLTKTSRLDVAFQPGTLPPVQRNALGAGPRRQRVWWVYETSLPLTDQAPLPGNGPGGAVRRVLPAAFSTPNLETMWGAPTSWPGEPHMVAQLASPLGLSETGNEFWDVQARTVEALVIQDPQTGRADVRRLVGEGKVVVVQRPREQPAAAEGAPEQEPLSVTGDRLELLNEGGVEQALHLTGTPAHLRRAGVHIEGDELFFDRAANIAKVIGKGMMQLPVHRSATGEELTTPSQLDLHWLREMVFDGETAHFLQGVRARLQDSVMRCDEMHVTLDRRIDFSTERPNTQGVALKHVRCQNGVEVEFYRWEQQEITATAKGRAVEFQLQYLTGDFEARGPGHLDVWQQEEQARVDVAPDAVARANQPVQADKLPWQYTNVRFAGRLTGNLHHKHGTLFDRVRVTYAPVERVLEVFVRDQLSQETESSKGAVWLGCDELQISLHPWEGQERDYVQLLAVGRVARVELEGRLFQANAETLSYDESTKLFTLRGRGGHKASVSMQDRPGSPYRDFSSQMLQFNPARRSVSIQGSDGAVGR